LIRWATTIQR